MEFKDRFVYRYYIKPEIMVVYNFENGATYYYDSISATLLNALFKKEEQEVSAILKKNDIDEETYIAFLDETEGLLNTSACGSVYENGIEENIIDNDMVISQISNEMYNQNILYRCHIDITGKCNYRCIHCYHPFEEYENIDGLSLSNIEELFEKLYKLGTFVITISGGEPFIRKDLFEILKIGKKYGFIFQILTNGYFIDEKVMQELKKYNVFKLSFSYYGSPESHYYITHNHLSRDKVMSAVDLCRKYNMKYEIKFILLAKNVNDFDDYVDLCHSLGTRILFEPSLIPKLNGDRSNFAGKLDFESYKKFMKEHLKYFYNDIDTAQYSDQCINCSAGRYGLYCDYRGDIYPCVSYREYLGKWSDIENIWNNSSKLEEIRGRKYNQFLSFGKYSFCKYCYQICPGLSLCENGNSLECHSSGCLVAQVIESVYNENIEQFDK